MSSETDLVIFGSRGDLSGRKLFPALYNLDADGLLPGEVRILALARQDLSTARFLEQLRHGLMKTCASTWGEGVWERFAGRVDYIGFDFSDRRQYESLRSWLHRDRVTAFYLATPPALFGVIAESLGEGGCLETSSRIVLEKPIGHDLASCREVNDQVGQCFDEENIYRIDHYLGKETVQNLLVLRFGNRFINTQWDQSCIDHVQITVAEPLGVGGRWSYYDAVGQLRDMVQNHLMQLLCLIAMEPPNAMTADSIRDEKIKIVRALRTIDEADIREQTVRGQYSAGWHRGDPVPGYLDEEDCANAGSDTETFVALKTYIDNWRWAGVPFYLRTGKRMPEKLTEVVITYKNLPHNIFSDQEVLPNRLVIRLQPNEGIEMQMVSKALSLKNRMGLVSQKLNLDFFSASEMNRIPDAYERLFLDVIQGDQSLFVGREEVEEAWRWCDTLIEAWRNQDQRVKPYHAGTWGPTRSELLIERDGRSWHE